MKSFNNPKEGSFETSAKLLGLVHQLMTGGEGSHATFDRVNVDGSNVGAVMSVARSSMKEVPECCGMSIYISNNIQGVNNSILVGSEVKMGEPGLRLSFGDVKWEREKCKLQWSKVFPSLRFNLMLITAFVLVVSLLFALFGIVSNEENRFARSFLVKERNEVIKFAT